MNVRDIENVMIKYKKAWESQDPDLILECFTEGAVYQESPVGKQLKGHHDIRQYWIDGPCSSQKDITFNFGDVKIVDNTAFVEWTCRMSRPDGSKMDKSMAGIMILKMEDDKISHLNEYWNVEEDFQ